MSKARKNLAAHLTRVFERVPDSDILTLDTLAAAKQWKA